MKTLFLTLVVVSAVALPCVPLAAQLRYSQNFDGLALGTEVSSLPEWTSSSPMQPSWPMNDSWYVVNHAALGSTGAETGYWLLRGHPFSPYGQDWATLHLTSVQPIPSLHVSFNYALHVNERVEIAISPDNVHWLDVTCDFPIVGRESNNVTFPAQANLTGRLAQASITTDLYLRFMAWNPTGNGNWHWFALDNLQVRTVDPAWNMKTNAGPPARTGAASAFDPVRNRTVIHGGYAGECCRKDDTWIWNGMTWTNATPGGPKPSVRYNHALAFDSARGVAVLFGGDVANGTVNGETWEWNGLSWTQRVAAGPTARQSHAMAYDAARGVVLLFGGQESIGGAPNNQTWTWNGSAWTNVTPGSGNPGARAYHTMAYDSLRQKVVLFGGAVPDSATVFSDTWEWNGTSWTQVNPGGPPPQARLEHTMAFDSRRGTVVLHGGITDFAASAVLNDTWEWNGGVWSQRSPGGPVARAGHTLAYDSIRQMIVLFGGQGAGTAAYFGDTWELPSVATICCPGDFNQSGTLDVADIFAFLTAWFAGCP